MGADRRLAARVAFRDGILPPRARARPGGTVVLVNLSGSGALVEGTFRFRPESRCELLVALTDEESLVRVRVVRSFVARLERGAPIRYRAAMSFEQPMQLPANLGALDGYRIPESLAGSDGGGVAATRTGSRPGESTGKNVKFSNELRRR
jgi:hypothetical protein